MMNTRIRGLAKAILTGCILVGVALSGPALAQSWFGGKDNSSVYVKANEAKPKRTWIEYLFGKSPSAQGAQVYVRNGQQGAAPSPDQELKISDFEPKTVEEMLERGRKMSLAHQPGLMKLAAKTRADNYEAERKHRMLMIELEAKSRLATQEALRQEQIGQMSEPTDEQRYGHSPIYLKPGSTKPSKVFTNYE